MIIAGTLLKTACGFIFDNPIGKALSGGALLVAAFMVWLWTHDAKVARVAKQELTTEINTKTQEVTDAGLKAREGANQPGAWDRLRKHHCRDC